MRPPVRQWRPPASSSLLLLLTVCLSLLASVRAQELPASIDASPTRLQPPAQATPSFNATSLIQSLLQSANATATAPASRTVSTLASSAIPTAQRSPNAAPATTPKLLDTTVDATFGVLGVLLILSGLALTFYGSRNRWTSLFLIGFWTTAMVVALIILATGVEKAVHPPPSKTRGLYLFASLASGAVVGAASVLWWQGAQYLCGAMGGFCVAIFLLALRPDGLIRVVWARYFLLVGFSTLGFAMACVPRFMHSTILFGSAALGATVLVLGIDCFTTGNLKEFYVYLVGTGVPKRIQYFPHTNSIIIELGVMAALFVAGIAFQLRFYRVLVDQARTLRLVDKERLQKEDSEAARHAARLHGPELAAWESKHGHQQSADDGKEDAGATPGTTEYLPRLDLATASFGNSRSTKPATITKPIAAAPLSDGWARYLSSRQIFRPSANQPKSAATRRPKPAPETTVASGRKSSSTNSSTPLTSSNSLSSSQGSFPITTSSSSGARSANPATAAIDRSSRASAPDYSQDSVSLAQQVLQSYSAMPRVGTAAHYPSRRQPQNLARASARPHVSGRTLDTADPSAGNVPRTERQRRHSDSAEHTLASPLPDSDEGSGDRRRLSLGDQLDRFAAAQRQMSGGGMTTRHVSTAANGPARRAQSGLPRLDERQHGSTGARAIRQSSTMPTLPRPPHETQSRHEPAKVKKHSWLEY
ncbi:hypothetical protein ACM66B_004941 [Microbotryomycetes sp. NB124-2]